MNIFHCNNASSLMMFSQNIQCVLEQQDWGPSTIDVGAIQTADGCKLIVNFQPKQGRVYTSRDEAKELFRQLIVFLAKRNLYRIFQEFQAAIIIEATDENGKTRPFRMKVWCDARILRSLEKQRLIFWKPLSRRTFSELVSNTWLEGLQITQGDANSALPLPP